MNNGQPPYGDPSVWGQQGQQVNPAQYPVQPPYTQTGYGQPQFGPNGYDQSGYVQQPMQQTGAFQMPQQAFEPVQTYQQQEHPQQTVYQQQSWQPYAGQPAYNQPQTYQQPGPQPQQFYGQNQQPMQQAYPQFNQQGQQMQQGYGYSGYYSQPQDKQPFELPLDVVAKAILFGVLPVLFILAMIFGVPALKWIFLAGAVGGIVLMWMKDVVSPNMRLTMSLVLGVAAVVALVGALGGTPKDTQNSQGNPGAAGNMPGQQGGAINQQYTEQPTWVWANEPTATPAPEDAADSAREQLMSFFYFWSVGNDEAMISLTAPSWRNSVENPQKALFALLLNRTPQDDYEITKFPGTDSDSLRTATVKVTIDKNDGRATKDRYSFNVIMKKEGDAWYVDPQSLQSNEKETAVQTSAAANTTPTQPPLYTGTPETILYYNANGGVRYHLDPDCPDVHSKFKPMTQFRFLDLGMSPYNELIPCNRCGAPIPDD